MKRYLPLLGVFLLFFLVISGFAHGQSKEVTSAATAVLVAKTTTVPGGVALR